MSDKKKTTVSTRNLSKPLSESKLDRKVRDFTTVANKVNRAKGKKVSYKSAYDAMSPKEKAKHGNSLKTFTTAAKKFNKSNPNYDKSKFRTRKGGSIL
jgi:hypothetical protein